MQVMQKAHTPERYIARQLPAMRHTEGHMAVLQMYSPLGFEPRQVLEGPCNKNDPLHIRPDLSGQPRDGRESGESTGSDNDLARRSSMNHYNRSGSKTESKGTSSPAAYEASIRASSTPAASRLQLGRQPQQTKKQRRHLRGQHHPDRLYVPSFP